MALRITCIFLAVIFSLAVIIPIAFGKFDISMIVSGGLTILFSVLAYRVGKKRKKSIVKRTVKRL